MAPVKRSGTTPRRETRATRAATVAKKTAITPAEKTELSAASKATPSSIRPTISTRKGKKTANEEQFEQQSEQEVQEQAANEQEIANRAKARITRAAAPSTGLAAAPRRRVKITPLDASTSNIAVMKEEPQYAKTKSNNNDAVKKTSTRAKPAIESVEEVIQDAPAAKSKTKTKSVQTIPLKPTDEQDSSEKAAPKTRGRPKSQKIEKKEDPLIPESAVSTRATRSHRGESTVSVERPALPEALHSSKPATGVRKKVTFQDLISENDKENQPLSLTKPKKATTKKGSEQNSVATGLRAKPLRKAPTMITSTRTRKAASTTTKETGKVTAKGVADKGEKKMPRALTPKKITQVAKSSSPEHDDSEASEGEDELNGGKTPIRDLSVSPRRPATAALARALSPAMKLDFGQSLVPKSPHRTNVFRDSETEQNGLLGSPARRPAASPFKDALRDSPKRGLNEGVRLLFPNQSETTSIVMNAPTANNPVQAMANILQSPKRTGVLDPSFFSQSAMKQSASRSPLKASLFGTPAKRLFSPTKKAPTPAGQEFSRTSNEDETSYPEEGVEVETEVTASSHFRSVSSPLRVIRTETGTVNMDFDDSILQVRSPLKIQKSPLQIPAQPNSDITMDDNEPLVPTDSLAVNSNAKVIEPSILNVAQGNSPKTADEIEDQCKEPLTHHVPDGSLAAYDTTMTCTQKGPTSITQPDSARRPSMSQILFRSNNHSSEEEEESSEDELARDRTPIRPPTRSRASLAGTHSRSRLSTGMPPSVQGKGVGFTPLLVQMSGWLASSPDKNPEQHQDMILRDQSEFSPLARQHIDGEVMISRDSTPVQKLNKPIFTQPMSTSKSVTSKRESLNLRKSLAQRQSLSLFSLANSPARNPQFEEYMEIRAMEEQADSECIHQEPEVDMHVQDFDHIMDVDSRTISDEEADDTILEHENGGSEDQSTGQTGDLTTDLINFTHASDTAMVDFQMLAEEAEDLASNQAEQSRDITVPTEVSEDQTTVETVPVESSVTGIDVESSENMDELLTNSSDSESDECLAIFPEKVVRQAESPLLQPFDRELESPSMLVIDRRDSPVTSPLSAIYSSNASSDISAVVRTPQPNLRLNERRLINTVVSKVPLKPEGSISPIKMPRKRSRSFGNSDASPPKRLSFENPRALPSTNNSEVAESPDRRVRTSVAPSPGGTSTPDASRSNVNRASRYSLASLSNPGQMSFAIDDFGDSTLDGIELPDNFDDATEIVDGEKSPARSESSPACVSSATTPKALLLCTPATARRSVRHANTPATATKKLPKSAAKPTGRASINMNKERTPLGPVGKGVLHGATVFVDVHTSEGADASGIFVELLTQMGARCVKEWRWNPRTSLAPNTDHEVTDSKIGITHVVYKDGGKRTLEKVRDAKGEVCCVGVGWVLDCERECKWLDESSYAIDTSIVPRGGSNRRKSMEPRALLVGNDGSVSASRARRSVSAEMNELTKRQLINTPARGQNPSLNHHDDQDDDEENDENVVQATPTGFVSYDPRTAMTPGTPYLVSQGKKLTQMSAPPKQQNKSLFDDEDEENNNNEDKFMDEGEKGHSGAVRDARKFRMKNLGNIANRRRTLGFTPVIGSPLGRS